VSDVKHTLGPWHRNIKPITRYPTIFAGRNTHLAKIIVEGIGLSEAEANADLIAAAPDLLEALQTIVRMADGRAIPGNLILDENSPLMYAARDAIAKATGEAK
jgi:hypothetical protein